MNPAVLYFFLRFSGVLGQPARPLSFHSSSDCSCEQRLQTRRRKTRETTPGMARDHIRGISTVGRAKSSVLTPQRSRIRPKWTRHQTCRRKTQETPPEILPGPIHGALAQLVERTATCALPPRRHRNPTRCKIWSEKLPNKGL